MRKPWIVRIAAVVAVVVGFPLALVIGAFVVTSDDATRLAPGTVPPEYLALVQQYGRMCPALTPPRLAAQLRQESGFNPRAKSSAGAVGIAQFLPATWNVHGVDANGDGVANISDPADAIASAASYDCYLADVVRNLPGNPVDNMLAAYNAGLGRVLAARGVPAIEETRNYVTSIRALERSFALAPAKRLEGTAAAAQAVAFAHSRLGTPYLWAGTGSIESDGRFDCSGLVKAAYASAGITLSRTSREQWYDGPHVRRNQLRAGNLVFFADDVKDPRTIHHVGIYVGKFAGLDYMIDAPFTGAVIRYEPVDYVQGYIGAVRVTGQPPQPVAAPSTGDGANR